MFWALLSFMAGATGAFTSIRERAARFFGAFGCVAGCGLSLYGAGFVLKHRMSSTHIINWRLLFGSLNLGVDSLCARWLIPAMMTFAMGAISAYRQPPGEYAANRPRAHWVWYNLGAAAAILVFLARNGVFFLFAWGCFLSAVFFLSKGNGRILSIPAAGIERRAGECLGWCALLGAFLTGARGAANLNFQAAFFTNTSSPWFWILLWIGFGALAGLFPFGKRYADAFASAPGQSSAIMGGIVPALAFYGFARIALIADAPPPAWWGRILVVSGSATALFAGGKALGERDLSRLIAWSSRKNSGIVAVCFGLALIGSGEGRLTSADFSVAALLMANHVLSGTLLHLCADNMRYASGARDLSRIGGLFKVMPATGMLFLLGAAWASLLPPFSGFSVLTRVFPALARHLADSASAAEVFLFSLLGVALTGAVAMGALSFGRALGSGFFGAPCAGKSYPAGREPPSRLVAPLGLAISGAFIVYATRAAFPALTLVMAILFALFAALIAGWRLAFGRRG
ncbi:MAG: hypothetical protein LBT97_08070 [Planctomycetota bacterium]|jgi:formate hydrogenlyase subunit 3/multisubunit Na+/H+ antiporter MnhD subunit|nr:hypothetical protein [Planctomycetota bacterium]